MFINGLLLCCRSSINLTDSLIFFLPQNDLKMYFRKDLSRRLLSADFKKQVDGIEMLHKVFLDITLLVPWISLDIRMGLPYSLC